MKTVITLICIVGMAGALYAPPLPDGDECTNAFIISSLPYCDEGNTSNFSDQYTDLDITCNFTWGGKDVFYSFTPPQDMIISISTCGTDFPSYLAVAVGCAAGLSQIACSNGNECDDFWGDCISGLSVTANTTYYIVIDGDDNTPGEEGNYRIAVQEGAVCPDCDEILPVELISFTALPQNRQVTLNWSTASEHNTDRFEIVRNGIVRGEVEASGGSVSTRYYSWIDNEVQNDMEYSYTLIAVDLDGARQMLGTVNAEPAFDAYAVTEYALRQNYPNPFNPTTTITVDIAEAGFASLKVYNLRGQEVRNLVNNYLPRGSYSVLFDGARLASGVYIYQLDVNDFSAQRKMILMK